jgi:UDP-N-acetylmuramyl pentapeptide phosphotransferase/UDP-N-acetylglucosamine-1-phosphate transferase
MVVVAAALLSAAVIAALLPQLRARAVAQPNARSSHRKPTPQGGGAGIILAALAVPWGLLAYLGPAASGDLRQLVALTLGAALLALVGAVDDMRGLAPLPRLIAQALAAGMVVAALPAELRVLPWLPWWLEAAGLVVGSVWFVNLTNFMDGIDWMTVAEVVPVAGAVALLGYLEVVPALAVVVALALVGAMLGFAPYNKPVARLFLGDVGSLPIGLVLAWLLLQVAGHGHIVAALLLPLYYLADTMLTLLRRAAQGEPVWQAHRTHFYQRATDGGFTVTGIVAQVFALNIALAALALLSLALASPFAQAGLLAAGAALVAALLARFAKGSTRGHVEGKT